MRIRIFLPIAVGLAAMMLFSVTSFGQDAAPVTDKDGMLIHIKSGMEDPHSVLMGLSLALKMTDDADVLVFFSVKGVHHIVKDAEILHYADFQSSDELLEKLIKSSAKLYACPMCLKAEGFDATDLRDGVGVMAVEQFFGFTEGRIVTLDF